MNGSSSSVFRSVRRPPRRRGWRTVKLVLAGLTVLALVAVGIVGAVWAEAWLRLGGEELPSLAGDDLEALGTGEVRAPGDATTVLVALAEEHDPVAARSAPLVDDVALVQVSERREEVAVLLLPATLPVTVDGEGDLELSAVHERGGLDLLARSVLDYTGVAVDHAVATTPQALPRLTRALGPVERCDEGGCRIMDEDAVRLVTTEGGPAERVEAAVDVVRGLAAQVRPSTPLRSPLRSRSVVSTLSEELVTDVSLRGTRILDVASALDSPRPVAVATLPAVTHPDSGRLLVRPEQAETLFQHLRQGTSFSGEEAGESTETVPAQATVAVLNGAGVGGLAGRVESQLQGGGFNVLGTGNAGSFDYVETVVAYHAEDPDAEVAAVLLAEQLGGVALDPVDRSPSFEGDPVDVVVTVGQDLDDEDEGDE